VVVVSEGAREKGGGMVSVGERTDGEVRLGGVSARVARELERLTGKETRNVVLGHLQRGGIPTAFDRMLCTTFGARAVDLIEAGDFGKMVALQGTHVVAVPIKKAIERLRTVPADDTLVCTARAMGISLGD
jgi:6-phosphofructokinase 1